MKYIAIFHANLNYAYLTPQRYEFVIRHAYEMLMDTMREVFPKTKYVFEASGYTVEQMAKLTPDVLDKLKDAMAHGQCEFMGSPYAHPMLANFPEQDGLWSLRFANEVYQRHLGVTPPSFWNPECGWRGYVPRIVAQAGYQHMIGDFEAYSRSCGPDGQPLRPEIYAKEHCKEAKFYNFGFHYDLPGSEKAIHFPFDKIEGLPDGKLRMFLRTDRIAQFGVRYFMGMEGYSLDKYMDLIRKYSQQGPGEPEGALIIFADDAEYIGTNGWFRLKYRNEPDHVFEATPQSRRKLIDLIAECETLGGFTTFDSACSDLEPLPETIMFDDDSAWHGGLASTWASTPMARLLRPWQDLVRNKLETLVESLDQQTRRRAWFHLTNSYNSDGQWPPTLPEAPHIVHPFNYRYCFDNLLQAEILVGGVDRAALRTDPVGTLSEILGPQQDLILQKARSLLESDSEEERSAGRQALSLIQRSRDLAPTDASAKILYPSEYGTRAELLVEARRLVKDIVIEQVP